MVDVPRPVSALLAALRVAGGVRGPAGVVEAWRRRSGRAAVSALLTQLATPPTIEGVQATLRAALGDPTAAVYYRLTDAPGFVSAAGETLDEPPDASAGRLVVDIAGQHGEMVGLLSLDGGSDVDTGRVEVALIACRPALENARLQAVLRSHLHAARESRARIVQTAVIERRRLARDLHDGAQQHLHALSASLSLARQKASKPQSVDAIDTAREQLRAALAKLRGLGRDLYPAVLDAEGLSAALESLADDGPLDLEVDSSASRLDPETDIVMYLTIRELVEGLAAYAAATQATVIVAAVEGRLSLRMTSDGLAGDDPRITAWLSVITDRIQAVGGEMSIRLNPDPPTAQGGICAEAWIPCE